MSVQPLIPGRAYAVRLHGVVTPVLSSHPVDALLAMARIAWTHKTRQERSHA